MSQNRSGRHDHRDQPDHGKPNAKPSRNIAIHIPQPFSVRQESTTEDHERERSEQRDRSAQLSIAKHLNRITVVGAAIALLSLFAVYIGIYQSRETFRAGQRAWVIVVGTPIVPFDQHPTKLSETVSAPIVADIPFSVPIVFKNTGLSPALKVHMHVVPSGLDGYDCPEYKVPSPYDSLTVIAPGEIATNPNAGFDLRGRCVDALNNGTTTYRIQGTIFYEDIFRISHETHFCIRYEGTGTKTMSACPNGNDAG